MAPEAKQTRIAIKLGAATSTSAPLPPRAVPTQRRAAIGALGHGSDSETEEQPFRREEEITGLGANGAVTKLALHGDGDGSRPAVSTMVIEPLHDCGWIASIKRRRRQHHQEPDMVTRRAALSSQHDQTANATLADEDGEPVRWGLVVHPKKALSSIPTPDIAQELVPKLAPQAGVTSNDCTTGKSATLLSKPKSRESETPLSKPKSLEDEAMNALLNARENDDRHPAVIMASELDSIRDAVRSAADVSTLEDYEAMPVEAFGAALLRGMGWNGDPGPKAKEIGRRPHGLGLGAKELKEAEDLGGWNQNASAKKPRPRLHEYRREEDRRKEERYGPDSYRRERERERDQRPDQARHHDRDGNRDQDWSRERNRVRPVDWPKGGGRNGTRIGRDHQAYNPRN